MKIDKIPADFIARDMENNLSEYYPAGVTDRTKVAAVIEYEGGLFLHEGCGQSFGWAKTPAAPGFPGLKPVSAAVTHYKILSD